MAKWGHYIFTVDIRYSNTRESILVNNSDMKNKLVNFSLNVLFFMHRKADFLNYTIHKIFLKMV
jgi:hypothetical protein